MVERLTYIDRKWKESTKKRWEENGVHSPDVLGRLAVNAILTSMHPRVETGGERYFEEASRVLEKGDPLVVMSNHLSNADGPLERRTLEEYSIEPVFLQGDKLSKGRFTKFLVGDVNRIHVWSPHQKAEDESENETKIRMNQKAVASAEFALKEGLAVVLYPEGTRSRDGEMKEGIGKTGRYTRLVEGTHILPISISGSEKVLPPTSYIPRPFQKVTIEAGELLTPGHISQIEQASAKPESSIIDTVMRRISKGLPEKYRGFYK